MKKVIIPIDKIIYKNGKLILRAYDSESQGGGGSVNPSVQEELDKKVDKITIATSGNFPSFTSSGGIQDSGYNYNSFQPKLTTQTAYSDKGSATKVPKITTNSLGQVTSIQEVEINIPTDSQPTENSTKPVTSGGVYKAIVDNEQTVAAALNDLNSKITSTGQDLSALSIQTSQDLGTISSAIEQKEKVTAAALNDLNSRLLATELYLVPDDIPYPIVEHTEISAPATATSLAPNKFHVWTNAITGLNVTLDTTNIDSSVMNEYVLQFSVDSSTSSPQININGATEWAGIDTFQGGKTYQVSVVNGYAIGVEFDTITQSS